MQTHVAAPTPVVGVLKRMLHESFGVEHATLEIECEAGGCAGTMCATCGLPEPPGQRTGEDPEPKARAG